MQMPVCLETVKRNTGKVHLSKEILSLKATASSRKQC